MISVSRFYAYLLYPIGGNDKNHVRFYFHIFSNELFLDLTVYQYGYEKCDPLHSYGPFVRNHYLFHYIISGKGMLSVTEKMTVLFTIWKHIPAFSLNRGRINLYSADQKFPWEYVWVEFDGLRAKELMEEAGLSNDHPVFHPISDTAADKLRDEMLRLTQYPDNSRPFGIIGQLYLIMDALIQGSSNKKKTSGRKAFQDFTHRKHFLLLNKIIRCQSQSKIWQIAVILTEAILVKFSKI